MKIRHFFYWLGRKVIAVYSKIMLRMSVVSRSPIPTGPKIIVANHPSGTDPFILYSVLKTKASILINEVTFKVPVFGKFIKYIGHTPVNKKKGHIAFAKALKLLKKGETIVIFVEGDFSPFPNRFLKPHTGAVRLALATGSPIIPIGIGLKNENIKNISAIFSGSTAFGKWYFQGPYAITIGSPVALTGNVDNRALVRNLTNKIMENIKRLSRESSTRIRSLRK